MFNPFAPLQNQNSCCFRVFSNLAFSSSCLQGLNSWAPLWSDLCSLASPSGVR